MKILVTGAEGQVGTDMTLELRKRGFEVLGLGRHMLDITDENKTIQAISAYMPDAVINCAAYTAVDKAETDREKCYLINCEGTHNLAKACCSTGAKLVHISTDYVFDGTKETAYETDDITNPINYYGFTKAEGEKRVQETFDKYFILRISGAFGEHGNNFVGTMQKLGERVIRGELENIKVVNDQTGSITYSPDLCERTADIVLSDAFGIYHVTNEGFLTWYELAKEIFRIKGDDIPIIPITAKEYNAPAQRPENSRLSKECLVRAGFKKLPDWHESLKMFIS